MKIAVVFHGRIGGGPYGKTAEPLPVEALNQCYKTISHNLISRYDTDVFAHSWSIEHQKEIIEIYKPTRYLFETQEYFGLHADEFKQRGKRGKKAVHDFRTLSRYASLKRAIELQQEHSNKHNVIYEWIVTVRYDLVILTPILLERFSNKNFYTCRDPYIVKKLPTGELLVHDIIFFSSPAIMYEYTKMDLKPSKSPGWDGILTAHRVAAKKLKEMFPTFKEVKYGLERFTDIDIYKQIMYPHEYFQESEEAKSKFEKLLKSLD